MAAVVVGMQDWRNKKVIVVIEFVLRLIPAVVRKFHAFFPRVARNLNGWNN